MSGQYYRSKNARCPYYRSEDSCKSYRIRCEGIAGVSWIHMVFHDLPHMLEWRDTYCKRSWRTCPFAGMRKLLSDDNERYAIDERKG